MHIIPLLRLVLFLRLISHFEAPGWAHNILLDTLLQGAPSKLIDVAREQRDQC